MPEQREGVILDWVFSEKKVTIFTQLEKVDSSKKDYSSYDFKVNFLSRLFCPVRTNKEA